MLILLKRNYCYTGLAQDGRLHYLSQDEQLFYSSEHHLVPECADLFLHSDLITSSFPDISIDNLQQVNYSFYKLVTLLLQVSYSTSTG